MNVAQRLSSAGLFVISDSRAKNRKTDRPETLKVSYVGTEDILETIAEVASQYPSPTVLILKTGQVMVMAEIGKAGIAVQGVKEDMTPEQVEALSVTSTVLSEFFGIPMADAPKKRTKKVASESTSATETVSDPSGGSETPETSEVSSESVSDPSETDPS